MQKEQIRCRAPYLFVPVYLLKPRWAKARRFLKESSVHHVSQCFTLQCLFSLQFEGREDQAWRRSETTQTSVWRIGASAPRVDGEKRNRWFTLIITTRLWKNSGNKISLRRFQSHSCRRQQKQRITPRNVPRSISQDCFVDICRRQKQRTQCVIAHWRGKLPDATHRSEQQVGFVGKRKGATGGSMQNSAGASETARRHN